MRLPLARVESLDGPRPPLQQNPRHINEEAMTAA
jgi:hypothetical protein